MERKDRTVLVVLIALVIAVAVFASFGLPLFANPTPKIELPTPVPTQQPSAGPRPGEERVEIDPSTVQSVIAALDRLESYSRTVTTTLDGAVTTAQVWVDEGWTRTDLTGPNGLRSHTIVGEGKVWRWYDGDEKALSWSGDAASADVEGQHIPTYEDVLALDRAAITAAGYEEKNGLACVYVEVDWPELGQSERYWVSADSGLLAASEILAGEETVYTMTATVPEIPVRSDASFVLPDGTVLHSRTALERAAQP